MIQELVLNKENGIFSLGQISRERGLSCRHLPHKKINFAEMLMPNTPNAGDEPPRTQRRDGQVLDEKYANSRLARSPC